MSQGELENRVFYFTAPREMEIRREALRAPAPGEIRCRTICSLVSIGTEMTCYERDVEPGTSWDSWIRYPFEPGYSTVGEVIDRGPGVEGLDTGDVVCSVSAHRAFFLDRPENVYHVPRGVNPEHAAWFQLDIIVQNGIREARPVLGENAVVIGLGPLGQLAVRLLGLCGMRELVAVDPLEARCSMARDNGPTRVFCERAGEVVDRVKELTGGEGADLVFDITGHPAVFHSAQHMLRKRGRLGLIGDVPRPSAQSLTHDVVSRGLSIVGAHGAIPPMHGSDYYRWGKSELTELFFHLLTEGRLSMEGLTTHRIAPSEAPAMYDAILADRSSHMGVIIDWSRSG